MKKTPSPMGNSLEAVRHYENFPVASRLLPGRLREPVRLIYAFARQADDFADEGDLLPQARLDRLAEFGQELTSIEQGQMPELVLFQHLAPVIRQYGLPVQLFRDLLCAFAQDVTKSSYADFSQVMDYCRRSANPVGRLLLHLFGATNADNLAYSDKICSALQWINFLQDIPIDYAKGRIYLPEDEMKRYGVCERHIAMGDAGQQWKPFMLFQIERVHRMLHSGAPLGRRLGGRIGLEIRMIVQGGERILKKLQRANGDIFSHRPVLGRSDWVAMLFRSTFGR